MLRSSSKTKIFGALVSFASLPILCAVSAFATASGTEVTGNTNFRVNVNDALTVSITTPDNWAQGDPNQFLRNRIIVDATTNAAAGLTASMTTKTTDKSLRNSRKSDYVIPTLVQHKTVAEFPTNYWGYTLDDDIASPRSSADYKALKNINESPIILASRDTPGSVSQDVYFGAKADMTKASGTYSNTVVISIVTGIINDPDDDEYDPGEPDNPVTPSNPSGPTEPGTPTYTPSNNQTTYTTVTPNQNNTTTTTTEVSSGDNRRSYQAPQGVKTTTTSVNEGSPLATGLAVTSAVAGATGFIFFLIGKRRKDDDEEEEGTGEQQPPVQQ